MPDETDSRTGEVACPAHPDAIARERCESCGKPVCELCLVSVGPPFNCPACRDKARGKRFWVWVIGLNVGGALFAAFMYLLVFHGSFDYGDYQRDVEVMELKLEREPCNKTLAYRYAELIQKAGNAERVVEFVEEFHQECEPYDRLLWFSFSAHKELNQPEEAIRVVSRLIEKYPFDKDFRWWRGQVHERQGRFGQALADYRQALTLRPRLTRVPFNLRRAAIQAGRKCEAVFPMEQLVFHHPGYREEVVDGLVKLYESEECGPLAGVGSALILDVYNQEGLEVGINGGDPGGRFSFSTDSSYVLLSKEYAQKLNLPASGPELLRIDGSRGNFLIIDKLEVEEASARRVEAMIMEEALPDGMDGILGLSFLLRFAVTPTGGEEGYVLSAKME
jgi:tetratricopeptide (TPR) repeat protein